MNRVEKLEHEVQALSQTEFNQFRAWFTEFDWRAWGRELKRDVEAGKLDPLADKALREHESGQTTAL